MQGKANQPAMKRVARPRGANRMDFGVQVYAKPPPPLLQACSQVRPLLQGVALAPRRPPDGSIFPVSACDQARSVRDMRVSLCIIAHALARMCPEGGLK